MNGYGAYVWASLACVYFLLNPFIRTYNKLKKYEKNFIKEIQELNKEEKKVLQTRSKIFTQVLKSQKK